MKKILVLGGGFTAWKRLNEHSLTFNEAPALIFENDSNTYSKEHLACTIDANPACEPTYLFDLNGPLWPINAPIVRHEFDECHAYEILEHLGRQGDADAFFSCFANIWWALKPGGKLFASVPSYKSLWAFGDPTHTRIINSGSLTFLMREQYTKQLGKTSMSDYRSLLVGDWELLNHHDDGGSYRFVLRAK